MGGIGSGRPKKNGLPTEFFRLDVRWLQRHKVLVPGCTRGLRLGRNGGYRAQLWTRFEPTRLVVDFDLGQDLFGARRSRFELRIKYTPCHYSGVRPWFVCPRETCRRRVAILYGREDFLCRRCRGVSYPIQRVPPRSRLLARAQMLRIRLGGTGDLTVPFPERPKGMHEWTYTRLAIRGVAAEDRLAKSFLEEFGKPKRFAGEATSDPRTLRHQASSQEEQSIKPAISLLI